jgi:hypothetical protein
MIKKWNYLCKDEKKYFIKNDMVAYNTLRCKEFNLKVTGFYISTDISDFVYTFQNYLTRKNAKENW